MPRPDINRVSKAMRGLTIGVTKDVQSRQKQVEEDGLQERVEEVRISISGRAEEFPSFSTENVKFKTLFVDATGQRDSPFTTPQFSYGTFLRTTTPVAITASVMAWVTNARNEVVGAQLAIGVSATDEPTDFKGELHATFSGFGQPKLSEIEDHA